MLTSAHSALDVRIFHRECRSLVSAGYNVVVVAPHDTSEVIDGVSILGVPRLSSRLRRMTQTVWAVYRKARRVKAHIYHFHDPDLIPAALLLRLGGNKVIYDVHECYPRQILSRRYLPSILRYPLAVIVRCIEIATYPCFSGLIAVDTDIARRCGGRAIVVGNYPVELPEVGRSFRSSKDQSAAPDGSLRLVYVGGRLSADRGLFKMIEALEHLNRPSRLFLIGRYSEADRRRAQQMSAYDSVEWLGTLPHRDALSALTSMDLGLLLLQPVPGYFDVSDGCLKLFEYMACGLPVVASHFPGLSRIVLGEQCGIVVDPTRARKIAEAINTLVGTPGAIEALAENGRAAIVRKYNWNTSAKPLLALYHDVLVG